MPASSSALDPSLPFAERIRERTIGPCRVFTLRTPVRDVVSWRSSFHTYPDLPGHDDMTQAVAVSLLDKGTRKRDRFALADVLENRGAQVRFLEKGLRVACTGRALREDLPEVLPLMAEQLMEPLFEDEEFEKARSQIAASLQRSRESTAAQATAALTRSLYTPLHPNYTAAPDDELALLQALTNDRVRAYHDAHFGGDALLLVFVGDIDEDRLYALVETLFTGWPPEGRRGAFEPTSARRPPERTTVHLPDKQNVDVRFGHTIAIRRHDPSYIPLFLGNYVLGGNFSSRLMDTIRDTMGLTYGIRSSLSGITTEYDGHWQVEVTLSQENLERGIEATRDQVERFVTEGATETEVEDKKTTLVGSYQVGLATTGGLASTILSAIERGFGVAYLDAYPRLIQAVTVDQVNETIRRYLDPAAFHTALAGALPEALVSAPA